MKTIKPLSTHLMIILLLQIYPIMLAQEKIYWVNQRDDKIQCSDIDGENITDIITTDLRSPIGIAIDNKSGKIYWSDFGNDNISRSNLDGSDIEVIISEGLDIPRFIDIDENEGKIYFVDGSSIKRANLDGSEIDTIVTTEKTFIGIALDTMNNKIYFGESEKNGGEIKISELDGTQVENIADAYEPLGIAIAPNDGYVFWVNRGFVSGGYWVPSPIIMRSSLLGDDVTIIANTNTHNPFLAKDIAVDEANDKIYWCEGVFGAFDKGFEKVCSSSYDGDSVEILVNDISGDPSLISIALMYGNSSVSNRSSLFINSSFRVFPNPVDDLLWIEAPDISKYLIQISSMNGQLIHNSEMEGSTYQLDLSSFQKGVYFITIRSKDFVTTRKILKY